MNATLSKRGLALVMLLHYHRNDLDGRTPCAARMAIGPGCRRTTDTVSLLGKALYLVKCRQRGQGCQLLPDERGERGALAPRWNNKLPYSSNGG